MRVRQAVADTGLCGEIDDTLRFILGEDLVYRCAISKVGFVKGEAFFLIEDIKPRVLQAYVVVNC